MKRILIILLVVCMIPLFASAEPDLSSMTDAELMDLHSRVHMEINLRETRAENVIFENDDFLLAKGTGGSDYSDGYYMHIIFMNKTDKKLGLVFDSVIIDGWEFSAADIILPIGAGRKTQETVLVKYRTAGYEKITDVRELGFSFYTYTEDHEKNVFEDIMFAPEW